MAARNQQKHLFLSFPQYKSGLPSLEELIKTQNSQKVGKVLTQ